MSDKIHTVTSKIQKVDKQSGHFPISEQNNYDAILDTVSKLNVQNSLNEILELSPYIKSLVESKEIGIVAAYHELATGKVHFEELI